MGRVSWLAVLLLGCDNGPDPFIEITSPEDGAVVCGQGLEIQMHVENFTLIPLDEGEEDARAGEGHIDLTVNGQDVDMQALDVMVINLEDGEWQVMAELVHADHSPVEPYASDLIYITADNSLCAE